MAIVRIFAHQGLRQLRRMLQTQKADDSVMVLTQPYLWKQALDLSGGVQSSAPDNADGVTILRVEVPPGITVGWEINNPGRSVDASADSPRLTGADQFDFSPGWTISLIDLTGVA